MKRSGCFLLCLSFLSGAICAEEPDPCGGLAGAGLTLCRNNEQTRRLQERLEQQIQQQQERQIQLDKQQREVQQQLESMRVQNESLRKELEREAANQPPSPAATNAAKNGDLKSWKADNPWFGSDYPKTQFAMRYMKELQQERPDLGGRALLDALSTKVDETFGAKH